MAYGPYSEPSFWMAPPRIGQYTTCSSVPGGLVCKISMALGILLSNLEGEIHGIRGLSEGFRILEGNKW